MAVSIGNTVDGSFPHDELTSEVYLLNLRSLFSIVIFVLQVIGIFRDVPPFVPHMIQCSWNFNVRCCYDS